TQPLDPSELPIHGCSLPHVGEPARSISARSPPKIMTSRLPGIPRCWRVFPANPDLRLSPPRSRRMRQALVMMVLAVAASQASAQVSSETVLDSTGYATTMVRNNSAEVLDVEVELRHGAVTKERIDLGERVKAVVSPSRFQLAPGESQLVRLLLREPLAADSVVRLVTTLTPRDAREISRTDGGAAAQLRFATRLVTRVRAQ